MMVLANGTQMGPFLTIESVFSCTSPCQDQKLEHILKTVHLTGIEDALNTIAIKILGVGIRRSETLLNKCLSQIVPGIYLHFTP